MLNKELYEYIQENELDTSDAEALLSDLRALTTKQHIEKSVVNNFIVSNNLNLRLRAITNQPVPHVQYDAAVPGANGLTIRLAAQAGLDWLLADSGAQVNPDNANLNALIGLLAGVDVFSADEVSAFWALFEKPRFPELQGDDEAALALVRGALNTPKIEQCESELVAIQAEYEAAVTPIVTRRDAWEQAKIKLANGEDVELPE